jgi:glycine cleavage system H protein
MAEFNKCLLPDDLYYHVECNVWVRDLSDDTYEVGMTDIAQSMAGAMLHCRPKKTGKTAKAGKSLGTVESGKWVGPVKAPFAGEITARNDAAEADATLINKSPYKDGWIVRMKPTDGAAALEGLLSAADAVEPFRAYMAKNDVAECTHCEGYDH